MYLRDMFNFYKTLFSNTVSGNLEIYWNVLRYTLVSNIYLKQIYIKYIPETYYHENNLPINYLDEFPSRRQNEISSTYSVLSHL